MFGGRANSKKRSNLALVVLILLSFTIITFSPASLSAQSEPLRLNGPDRYQTAIDIVQHISFTYPPDAVILARGDEAGGYADAMAAGVLAGAVNAPVLLTAPNALPAQVEAEIIRLGVGTVYLLGGPQAISSAIETRLQAIGVTPVRISGDNRFATAAQISKTAQESAYVTNLAYIVNGFSPADSLVVGPAAARNLNAVLQVQQDKIPQETLDTLTQLGITQVVIVGGPTVISSAVESQLQQLLGEANVSRISGQDREETSLLFAQAQMPGASGYLLVGRSNVVDGLAGAYLGMLENAPILYTPADTLDSRLVTFFEQSAVESFTILGGELAVSAPVASGLWQALNPPTVPIPGPQPSLPDTHPASPPYFYVSNSKLYGSDFQFYPVAMVNNPPAFLQPGNYYVVDTQFNFSYWNPETGQLQPVGWYDYRNDVPYYMYNLNIPSLLTAAQLEALAPADSPFRTLGSAFIRAQETWGINAYYLMAHAALESNWGRSALARDKNNLYGFMAYDSNPYASAATFNSKEDCIMYVAAYIKRNYLTSGGRYYNGSHLFGMNVRYATDPMWGVKIANIMQNYLPYNTDTLPTEYVPTGKGAVYFPEWRTEPDIYLNVRSEPSVAGGSDTIIHKLYFGDVVEIVDQSYNSGENRSWYLVNVVDQKGMSGWVASEYIILQ